MFCKKQVWEACSNSGKCWKSFMEHDLLIHSRKSLSRFYYGCPQRTHTRLCSHTRRSQMQDLTVASCGLCRVNFGFNQPAGAQQRLPPSVVTSAWRFQRWCGILLLSPGWVFFLSAIVLSDICHCIVSSHVLIVEIRNVIISCHNATFWFP